MAGPDQRERDHALISRRSKLRLLWTLTLAPPVVAWIIQFGAWLSSSDTGAERGELSGGLAAVWLILIATSGISSMFLGFELIWKTQRRNWFKQRRNWFKSM